MSKFSPLRARCRIVKFRWNPAPPRINLIAAGLAFWVLSELVGHMGHV